MTVTFLCELSSIVVLSWLGTNRLVREKFLLCLEIIYETEVELLNIPNNGASTDLLVHNTEFTRNYS